jgi:hypothetical protein
MGFKKYHSGRVMWNWLWLEWIHQDIGGDMIGTKVCEAFWGRGQRAMWPRQESWSFLWLNGEPLELFNNSSLRLWPVDAVGIRNLAAGEDNK